MDRQVGFVSGIGLSADQGEQRMSDSIENLLIRNLHEVFGERDPARRTTAIEAIFDHDCLFTDPGGRHNGHRGLEDAVVALQTQFPDHLFSQIGSVDVLQDSGRLAWAFGPSHEPRRITGLDVAVVNAGRISALYTFLDPSAALRANAETPDLPITDTHKISHQQNIAIAQKLLEGIGGGQDPAKIAALFDADLMFEIQGDDGVLPWIGRRTGRQAIADFIRDIRTLTEPVSFDVEDILASDSRAAIIGALQTRIKATNKTTATQFAIILTITGDVVTRFQMLEDSFDVSTAART